MRTIKEIYEKYVSGELKPTELVGNLIDGRKETQLSKIIFLLQLQKKELWRKH